MYFLKPYIFSCYSVICLLCHTSAAPAALDGPTIITNTQLQASGSAIPISHGIGALSIEFCYIVDYLGDVSQPNLLSKQLLQNIQDRVGAPPTIRIGGHTQDVAEYCENCNTTLANIFEPGNLEAVNVTFGKGLFTALNENVPSKQQFIFGLDLAQDDVKFPLAEVVAAKKYLEDSRLKSFELGNEPDFYNVQRPNGWNVQLYAQQVIDWMSQIRQDISNGSFSLQLGAFAQEPIWMGNFSQVELSKMGMAATLGIVSSLSDHTYPFSICDGTF
jgi:hypothetical protein